MTRRELRAANRSPESAKVLSRRELREIERESRGFAAGVSEESATETAPLEPGAPADQPQAASVTDDRVPPAAPPAAAPQESVLTAPSLIAFDEVEAEATAPVILAESKPIPTRENVPVEHLAAPPAAANIADAQPNPVIRHADTQPQPTLPKTTSVSAPQATVTPESIRRTRATALRGRRPIVTATKSHPPAKPRRRTSTVIRKIAAGGVLLFAGAFVVATTVPAQAFQMLGGAGDTVEWYSADAQTVDVPVNASQLDLHIGGDIGVEDALASARLSPERIAEIQAAANRDVPAAGYRSGVTGYEATLPMLETSYVQTPFPNLSDVPISSGFAWRWGKVHEGVDFTPGAGTEIRPMANGIVTNIQLGTSSGGHMVTIDHMIDGKRFQTVYAHMIAGSIQVTEGQVVTIDDVIGQVGSTGFSTGPHLHFELRTADDIAIDAIRWWENRVEYTAAMAAAGLR